MYYLLKRKARAYRFSSVDEGFVAQLPCGMYALPKGMPSLAGEEHTVGALPLRDMKIGHCADCWGCWIKIWRGWNAYP